MANSRYIIVPFTLCNFSDIIANYMDDMYPTSFQLCIKQLASSRHKVGKCILQNHLRCIKSSYFPRLEIFRAFSEKSHIKNSLSGSFWPQKIKNRFDKGYVYVVAWVACVSALIQIFEERRFRINFIKLNLK